MNCPKCGRVMVKRWDGVVLTSDPPQYPWSYCCDGCGHTEAGGAVRVERPE